MTFLSPCWLGLLPLLAVGGGALWLHSRREFHRRLSLLVAARLYAPLVASGARYRLQLRVALTVGALLALTVALARPLGGLSPQAARRQGVNLFIALDASRSMQAEDVPGSRFAFAQAAVDGLLGRLQGDRAGLMLFGGQATLVAPLTFDTLSLQLINRGLSPEWVGKGGSSPTGAIRRAVEYFRRKPPQARVLLLITDGEETEGDAVVAAQEAFRKDGIRVFTVGTGTVTGAPIPLWERNLQRTLIRAGTQRDARGQEVTSRLDDRLLRRTAEAGGGTYLSLSETDGSLIPFYEKSLQPLAAPMEDTPLSDYTEWCQLPLGLAFVLLVWEAWVGIRLRPVPASPPKRSASVPTPAALGLILLATLLCVPSPTRASIQGAQQLIAQHRTGEAFAELQAALLQSPDDALARYNYAVGAYADGKYAIAIEAFDKLAESADPAVDSRSQFQLGNSLYRSGEAMRSANSEGAIGQWEKALNAYRKVAENPVAMGNYQKVRTDLLTVLREFATQKEAEGDAAARLSPEKGVPAWREAVGQIDKALKWTEGEAEKQEFAEVRANLTGKIYQAYMDRAADQRRRAEVQKDSALERAIELLAAAAEDYTEALAIRPGDPAAQAGKDQATALLDPWRVELADQLHAAGFAIKATSLDDAIALWQKAASHYARVLEHDAAHAAALAGQKRNQHALHDGYVDLGDFKEAQAVRPGLPPLERDGLLEQALDHYQTALRIEPDNAATQKKRLQAGIRLTGVFVKRGRQELTQGRELAKPKPPEAISWLERSVQSFGKALQFEPAQAAAKSGKQEAEDLLKKLRDLDARDQRKVLTQSKDLANPKQLEDPGKLALKLLDYDNTKLASKKQQNYTAPENRPLKDW